MDLRSYAIIETLLSGLTDGPFAHMPLGIMRRGLGVGTAERSAPPATRRRNRGKRPAHEAQRDDVGGSGLKQRGDVRR